MNAPIGDKLFQHIPRRMANFRKNQLRDVENLADGRKIKKLKNNTNQNITVSRYRRSDTRATVINNAM